MDGDSRKPDVVGDDDGDPDCGGELQVRAAAQHYPGNPQALLIRISVIFFFTICVQHFVINFNPLEINSEHSQ